MKKYRIIGLLVVLLALVLTGTGPPQATGQVLERPDEFSDTVFTKAIFDKIAEDTEPVIKTEDGKLVMRELPYYHFVAESTVSGGVAYESEDRRLTLKPVKMQYDDGTPFKSAPDEVNVLKHPEHADFGMLVEGRPGAQAVGVYYPNAFGPGNNIGVLTHKYKIKEVESINAMPVIPKGAESLDIWFELGGNLYLDWDYDKTYEITEPVKLGNNSWLNPAKAWDSQYVWDWVDQDYVLSTNEIQIPSYLHNIGGKYYYIKSIPVGWLNTAQYPVYTDADISWGSASEFNATSVDWPKVCRVSGSSTLFAVAYADGGASGSHGDIIIGQYAGGTSINWGTETQFATALHRNYCIDLTSPADDIIVVMWQEAAANDTGYVRATEVSGTSCASWGSAVTLNDEAIYPSLCDLDTDTFAGFCQQDSGDRPVGYHFTLSGSPKTTITKDDGPEVVSLTDYNYIDSDQIDTNKVVLVGDDAANGNMCVLEWQPGTSSWSQGTEVTLTGGLCLFPRVATTYKDFSTVDRGAVMFRDNSDSDKGNAYAFTVAGGTITLGAKTTWGGSGLPYKGDMAFVSETANVILTEQTTNSGKLYSYYNTIDWGTRVFTVGTGEEVDSDDNGNASVAYLQSAIVAGVYTKDTDTSGQGRIGAPPPSVTPPTVTSDSITNVGTTTALATGVITAIGSGTPVERGFCYITGSGTPDYSDTLTSEAWASGTGSYSLTVSSLTCGTYYSIRAYAATSAGTGYGGVLNFATVPGSGCYTTDLLYLEYEPVQISGSVIADQSGNDNDVYYTLGGGTISVTLGGLITTGEQTYLSPDAGVPGAWGITEQPDGFIKSEEEKQPSGIIEQILYPFYQTTGIGMQLMYSFMLLCACAYVISRLTRFTNHLVIITLAVCFVTAAFYALGPLEGWVMVTTALAAIGAIVWEFRPQL